MVTSCVALGCTNRVKSGSGISFHRFPHKNPQLLEKWIKAIRRENWQPTHYSFICSVHFEDSCFVVRPGKIGRHLYEHAVPSIFNFPDDLQKKKIRKPMKRKRPLPFPATGESSRYVSLW